MAMTTRRRIRHGRGDRAFIVFNYAFLTAAMLIVLYPLIYIVSASFSSAYAVVSGRVVLFPVDPTLSGYKAVFNYPRIWVGYANSLYYTAMGTLLNIGMTLLAAYPLSRKDYYGRGLVMIFFAITMFFSGGLIPSFLLVNRLGMMDTRWALIIPAGLSVWNVMIARAFLQTNIPLELLEASQLDGCSDLRFLLRVVVPLSGPVIAVLSLWCAVGFWNSYYSALIYIKNEKLYPLQLILREVLIQNTLDPRLLANVNMEKEIEKQGLRDLLKYSLIVVATLPVLMIYPFVQRYFVKGVLIGAIKG
jgi:putative aldouronate transport system permease protein